MRGQRHAPAALYPRERTGTHYTGGWVGPRAGLDRCEKSRPTGIRSPDRPARSQSLYRLRYRAHTTMQAGYIAFMCFVWLSEERVPFALHIINRMVFITEAKSVYYALGTDSLYRVIKSLCAPAFIV